MKCNILCHCVSSTIRHAVLRSVRCCDKPVYLVDVLYLKLQISRSLLNIKPTEMFTTFPLEIVENILFYLSFRDILSVFLAFNKHYDILSDFFWKTICRRDDFNQAFETQPWYKSFQCGVNKKLGNFVQLRNVPTGFPVHVYLRSLVIRDLDESGKNVYKVYFLDNQNNFTLTQIITEETVIFKQELMLVQVLPHQCLIHTYNYNFKIYNLYKSFSESVCYIFGISNKYCIAYRNEEKLFNVYSLQTGDTKRVNLPQDITFLMEKVLHDESLVISALILTEGFKIKVYNMLTQSWTLDLFCYNCTGISTAPTVWVGSNFIGCCNVSFRGLRVYFGPFRVWNKEGIKILQIDVAPSTDYYIRCFFNEKHIILTTSHNTVCVFNFMGENIFTFLMITKFLDIKLNCGSLIFVILDKTDSIKIFDCSNGSHLYSIKMNNQFKKSLCSELLYCPYDTESNTYEVIKFF